MRTIRVNEMEFDKIFWGSFAATGAKNESELEIALRVLKKLKGVSLDKPLSKDEVAQGMIPNRKLIDEEAEFIFEEDEYGLVKDKLVVHLPNISLILADVFYGLLTRFKEAEKWEVGAEPEVESEDV